MHIYAHTNRLYLYLLLNDIEYPSIFMLLFKVTYEYCN